MRTSSRHPYLPALVATFMTCFALGFGDVTADELDDKTRAQTLFLEGRKAIDSGDWATGCPKVRQSLDLFAVANSHFTVAQCDEQAGHIASALDHWERGAALVDDGNDPRTKVAKERIAALEPRVPRIRVVVPPASSSAAIYLDGAKLEPAALVAPLRVEPGTHVFVVKAASRNDSQREIKIAERERTEFVAKIGEPNSVGPVPTGSGTVAPPPGTGAPAAPMPPMKVAGFVVGGVGVASLLVSAITGGMVVATDGKLGGCDEDKCSITPDKADLNAEYQSYVKANLATFMIGLAATGGGLAMILAAPKNAPPKMPEAAVVPLVLPGGAGIGLSGRF